MYVGAVDVTVGDMGHTSVAADDTVEVGGVSDTDDVSSSESVWHDSSSLTDTAKCVTFFMRVFESFIPFHTLTRVISDRTTSLEENLSLKIDKMI